MISIRLKVTTLAQHRKAVIKKMTKRKTKVSKYIECKTPEGEVVHEHKEEGLASNH